MPTRKNMLDTLPMVLREEDGELVQVQGRKLAPGEFATYLRKQLDASITNKADAAWELIQQHCEITELQEELTEKRTVIEYLEGKVDNLDGENSYLACELSHKDDVIAQLQLEVEHLRAQATVKACHRHAPSPLTAWELD